MRVFQIYRHATFLSLVTMIVILSGCVSGPSGTAEEKRGYFQKLEETTLADLARQHPEAGEVLEESVGYAVIEKKILKVPVFGGGGGVGVVVEKEGGKRSYLRIPELQFGAGWGGRGEHIVIVFQDLGKLQKLADGIWRVGISAEASAKAGDVGAAGGATADAAKSEGYRMYVLTDAGVSATATLNVLHAKPYSLE